MAKKNTEESAPETADNVDVEPTTVAEDPEVDPPKMADIRGVRYVGLSDVKRITKEDLESLGVENPKGDLEWSAQNGRFVVGSEINAATRDVLAAMPDFVVE